jgi:signal transduction histidine kinase
MVPIGKYAIWVLGGKKSDTRFWKEDLDLIQELVRTTRVQLEKIEYIQRSFLESIEKEQAQKKSEWRKLLISEVAHDLRSPLNTLQWRLKNFQNDLKKGTASNHESVENMHSQIFLMQKYIESLLFYARMEHGNREITFHQVTIISVIEECLLQLEQMIKQKDLTIQVNCSSSLQVNGEETLFQIILLNIIQNAIKFSPTAAKIEITGEWHQSGQSEDVRLSIQDEAGGIPPEIIDRLFLSPEINEEKSNTNHGFHLGLYMANQFTNFLGGKISFTPIEGVGTTVTLIFPQQKTFKSNWRNQ